MKIIYTLILVLICNTCFAQPSKIFSTDTIYSIRTCIKLDTIKCWFMVSEKDTVFNTHLVLAIQGYMVYKTVGYDISYIISYYDMFYNKLDNKYYIWNIIEKSK